MAQRFQQPAGVERGHPFQRRVLHVVEATPRTRVADHLGLEQADHRLGERVVIGIAAISLTVATLAPGFGRSQAYSTSTIDHFMIARSVTVASMFTTDSTSMVCQPYSRPFG